jgi:uncharacterized protein YndB with AHSA1/START domain
MDSSIVVERTVPASPELVYRAWLETDQLARWWWPHLHDTTYRVDPRAGGTYEFRSDAAGIGVTGEYRELVADRRLRMTWVWLDGGVPESEEPVVVDLVRATDGGTVVTVRHELTDPERQGQDIRRGWEDVLERLARVFADTAAGSD